VPRRPLPGVARRYARVAAACPLGCRG
jgi:hypothetical protein